MTHRLLAIAAVFGLTFVSALTVNALVVPELWAPRTLVCVGIAAAVIAVCRARFRSPVWPSLIGLAAGLWAISAVFFPEEAVARILPTRATLTAIAELVPATLDAMRTTFPPVSSGLGVPFLVATAVLVVFVLAELLAVGAWAPAWAGLPVLAMWAVPVVLGADVSVRVVVAAAVLYVAAIAIQARDDARYRKRPDARTVRATTVVTVTTVVLCLVAAPTLLRVPVPVRWHPYYELAGSSTTRLDLGLDLRDDLNRSDGVVLFSYVGAASSTVGPLHAYTMTQFDGSQWFRDATGQEFPVGDDVIWPVPTDDLDLGEPVTIEITINNLGQNRLLLPGEPRRLVVPEGASYDPAADEVLASVGSEVAYEVSILPRNLDPAALASLPAAIDVPEEFLQIPDTEYAPDIAELAQQIAADAGAVSAYDQAVAIQNYLRDPSRFTYSTTIASPRTPDAVWDFLQDRNGYCVQFATSMVMMARSLGIPARLAVGFLPGETNAAGVTEVTGSSAHAWPQIWFDGVGWVRFEPTPGVQAGTPPTYAPEPDPSASSSSSAAASQTPSGATSSASAAPSPSGANAGTGESQDRSVLPWVVVLIVMVGLAAAIVLLNRRSRLRVTDIRQRWSLVLMHLERLGIDTSESQTPRSVVEAAADVLDPPAWEALSLLGSALERIVYDRADAKRPNEADIDLWVEQVLDGARDAQRRRSQDKALV